MAMAHAACCCSLYALRLDRQLRTSPAVALNNVCSLIVAHTLRVVTAPYWDSATRVAY